MSKQTRALDRIYAKVPAIDCKRLCQAYCGVIPWQRVEKRRVARLTGAEPGYDAKTLDCSLLAQDGSCSAYGVRPLICRLWSSVDMEGMRCPHGCVPERWLSQAEAVELVQELARL